MKKRFKAIELKYLDEETINRIRIWRNQPFVKEKMYNQHDITEEEHYQFINRIKADKNRGLFVFFLNDEPFGVYQYEIHPEGNYMTGGNYLTSQEFQDIGYGVIQMYFIMEIVFNFIGCNKNYGEILDTNKRMIVMNKRIGIQIEGILRQQVIINNEYHDIYCCGILKKEWLENRDKIYNLVSKFIDKEYQIIK